jgi:NAD(P)-dependent dehydrogenase (short-subunit alcohol dehydrogenase family)
MTMARKVAIVTGASQGIGAGLVDAFRARDYRVVANSRSIKPSADPDILAIAGDISDPATAARIVNEALRGFGRIDTLINNAGIFIGKPFTHYTPSDLTAAIGTNLTGFFHLTQNVVAEMIKLGSGHVVTITASLADQPNAKVPSALTALTKGGLNAVTRSLATELAARGIRVNAVSPGVIKTPMHPAERHEVLAGQQPLRRLGEVRDIVEAVLFLESASFVTGEILHVDGGQSAGR